MLYLFLAIILGSLFAVLFKICQKKNIDTAQVILFNYVTAVVFSSAAILFKVWGGKADFATYALDAKSILLAILQGAFFYAGFFIMNRSTWRSGVALTTAAARASLVIPLILSWLIFSQSEPSWLLVGMILVAMLLMVLPAQSEKHDSKYQTGISEKTRRRKTMLALVAVFVIYGLSDFLLKVVQNSVQTSAGLDSQKVYIFLSATVVSLVACIASGSFKNDGKRNRSSLHQGFRMRNLIGGIILGLINAGCTSCMLLALGHISTSTFYPLYNIGIVVLATLVGVLFFKEKLKLLQVAGLVLAAAAIALSL